MSGTIPTYCSGSIHLHLCAAGCCYNGTTTPCCQVTTQTTTLEHLNIYSGYALCGLFAVILMFFTFCMLRMTYYKRISRRTSQQPTSTNKQPQQNDTSEQTDSATGDQNLTYTIDLDDVPPPTYSDVINELPMNEPPPYHVVLSLPQNDMIYCHL